MLVHDANNLAACRVALVAVEDPEQLASREALMLLREQAREPRRPRLSHASQITVGTLPSHPPHLRCGSPLLRFHGQRTSAASPLIATRSDRCREWRPSWLWTLRGGRPRARATSEPFFLTVNRDYE